MAKDSPILDPAEKTIHHEPTMETSVSESPIDGMMAEERRTQILQIVRSAGRVKVNLLTKRFKTSAVTIRNDLNELHQRGLVLRSHGGAVLPDKILRESPVVERLKAFSDEKRRIGAMAAASATPPRTVRRENSMTTPPSLQVTPSPAGNCRP